MAGVADSKTIDLVTHRQETDEVILVMTETRPWETDGRLLVDLQEKLYTYLDFVETGQLARRFPRMADKPIRIRLDCVHRPGSLEDEFFEKARQNWLNPLGIALEVGSVPSDQER